MTHTTTTPTPAVQTVIDAASAVLDNLGRAGSARRADELAAAIDHVLATDPALAVLITAARWTDRTPHGATGRLTDLQDTIDGLNAPTRPTQAPIP